MQLVVTEGKSILEVQKHLFFLAKEGKLTYRISHVWNATQSIAQI